VKSSQCGVEILGQPGNLIGVSQIFGGKNRYDKGRQSDAHALWIKWTGPQGNIVRHKPKIGASGSRVRDGEADRSHCSSFCVGRRLRRLFILTDPAIAGALPS